MTENRDRSLVALLHGPDQAGIVARVAGWIFEHGGNIIHADQHRDHEAGIFFQRVEWSCSGDAAADEAAFARFAEESGHGSPGGGEPIARHAWRSWSPSSTIVFTTWSCARKQVSSGGDLVAVVSNHDALRDAAEGYGLPYHLIPVEKGKKAEAETAAAGTAPESGGRRGRPGPLHAGALG